MSLPDQGCLAAIVQAPDVHTEADFISDNLRQVGMLALAGAAMDARQRTRMQGKTVMLALSTQLETVGALLGLDGVARRIVIWPHLMTDASLSGAADRAGVDVLLTTWPVPHGPAPARKAADPGPALLTEWVLFTSGTTGRPKMVVHSLASLCRHLLAPAPAPRKPEWCTFYDIRRYGGMQVLLRALVGGGSLVLTSPQENFSEFLVRASAAGRTHFLGTPSHWRRALMTQSHRLIAPTYVRLSGEVADQIILDRLRTAYPYAAIVHAFASTEAGLAFEVADGRAGFPAALISQNAGRVELDVSTGTLRIRSPRCAAGRLSHSLEPIAGADGFIDTGDRVLLRGDRYHLIGRADAMVNVGGQKIHPEEVEAVINQHPAVQMSLVTSRASPITGAVVVADVVTRPGTFGTEAASSGATKKLEREIQAFCRTRLEPFQVPYRIRLVPNLEISPAGKLVRAHA